MDKARLKSELLNAFRKNLEYKNQQANKCTLLKKWLWHTKQKSQVWKEIEVIFRCGEKFLGGLLFWTVVFETVLRRVQNKFVGIKIKNE